MQGGAMISERSRAGQSAEDTPPQSRTRTNHDAVPEAIADSTHERPPNVRCQQTGESRCAASGSGSGTGNTHRSVEESSRPRRAHNPEIAGANPAAPTLDAVPEATARTDAASDRTDKAALRPGEGTGDTPQQHATPTQGSVPYDGSVPDSRTENEPVAWGVRRVGGSWVSILANEVQAETSRKGWDTAENWAHEAIPLYLRPPCQDFSQKNLTLTDAEREAIEAAANHADWCDKEIDGVRFEASAVLRGLLERLGGER